MRTVRAGYGAHRMTYWTFLAATISVAIGILALITLLDAVLGVAS